MKNKKYKPEKIQKIKYNFFWRYRNRMFKREEEGDITVSSLMDFVYDKAPKTIKEDKSLFVDSVNMLWGVVNDTPIMSYEMYQNDFDEWMDFYKNEFEK